MSASCLRPETLKAVNRVLVDFHYRLPISSVWGTGIRSSSDVNGSGSGGHQDRGVLLISDFN